VSKFINSVKDRFLFVYIPTFVSKAINLRDKPAQCQMEATRNKREKGMSTKFRIIRRFPKFAARSVLFER
jgi:hypothetical protein